MTKIAFLINGDPKSAMGQRANEFASRLAARYNIDLAYRSSQKLKSIVQFFVFLWRTQPAISYVFDMAYSGVLAAVCYKLVRRNKLVIDTGDAIYELARSAGGRSRIGLWLTRGLEWGSFQVADHIVVRGSYHQRWLATQGIVSTVIQDGVDTTQFAPTDVSALRQQLGLDRVLTIGLIGSSMWSEKLQMCYGWELVELIRLLKEHPVVGVMIGAGSGIAHLQARCREYGIEDRLHFWGYVPYDELPERLCLMDVCLSTQTNDLVGQVRTTGKLPLYLAAGRYVLASDVGEAALVLPPEMRVPYDGVQDQSYPGRLAKRIESLLAQAAPAKHSIKMQGVAQKYFEYSVLAMRLERLFDAVVADKQRSQTEEHSQSYAK